MAGQEHVHFPAYLKHGKREREIFVRTGEVQETVKNYKIKNKIREQLNKKTCLKCAYKLG